MGLAGDAKGRIAGYRRIVENIISVQASVYMSSIMCFHPALD